MKYGPDGGVYLTDWYDTGECHETDADNAHRENGRIYKIVHGKTDPVQVDLARLDDDRPGAAAASSQRMVCPHGAAATPGTRGRGTRPGARPNRVLREILATNPDVTRQLRAAWALVRDRRPRRRKPAWPCSITRASISGRGE